MKQRFLVAVGLVVGCSADRADFASPGELGGASSVPEEGVSSTAPSSAITSGTPSPLAPGAGFGNGSPAVPTASMTSDSSRAGAETTVPNSSGSSTSAFSQTAALPPSSATGSEPPQMGIGGDNPTPMAVGSAADPLSGTQPGAMQPAPPNPTSSALPGSGEPSCEQAECCATADCGAGRSCSEGKCSCNQGSKDCNGQCIDMNACCTDDDCPSGGSCDAGECKCPDGTHQCADTCADDQAPETCGSACEPCPAPEGGSAGCDGMKCTAICDSDEQVCAGSCIAKTAACNGQCDENSHDCGGTCAAKDSVLACGTQCSPCPVPSYGKATCDGERCDFSCDDTHEKCGSECIDKHACCADTDCDNGLSCQNHSCKCADGQKLCTDRCVASSGCCSDQECRSGESCQDDKCVDETAPTVASTQPANNAKGVTADATVQITFSEPMDKDSVASAVTVSGLSSSDVTLSWNNSNTTLQIVPKQPLAYAQVDSTSGAAKQYTVSVGSRAKDAAGNALTAMSFSFSTLRDLNLRLNPNQVLTTDSYSLAAGSSGPTVCVVLNSGQVGEYHQDSHWSTEAMFAVFDANGIMPANQVSKLISAELWMSQQAPTAGFYSAGSVQVDQVQYVTPSSRQIVNQSVRHAVGTISSGPAADSSRNEHFSITDGFWSDWQSGANLMLFRLNEQNGPENEYANFSCEIYLKVELLF